MSLHGAVVWAHDDAGDESANKAAGARYMDFFEKQIAPILRRRCYQCHSHESGKAKGGLVLDSRRGWQQGGSEGAAIIPGKPDESLLIQAVRYEGYEMPPEGKLPAAEIALLEKWIAIGAPDPRESKVPTIDPEKLWARLQLAHWLTDPDNPLTSRVMVNRIWHHLFGKGLVRSVDYFGVHGETPSAQRNVIRT